MLSKLFYYILQCCVFSYKNTHAAHFIFAKECFQKDFDLRIQMIENNCNVHPAGDDFQNFWYFITARRAR